MFDFHKQIPIISLNNFNRLVLVKQTASVLCTFMYNIDKSLQGFKNRVHLFRVNRTTDETENTVSYTITIHVRYATFPIASAQLRHTLSLPHRTSPRQASHLLVLKFRRPSKAVAHPVASDASR